MKSKSIWQLNYFLHGVSAALWKPKKKYKSQKYRFLRCFSLLPFNDPLHFLQWILNNPVV